MRRTMGFAATILAGIWMLAGCGGGSSSLPPTTGGIVTVYPGAASVPVGQQVQFSAYLPSQPAATFNWSVSGGSSNGSISAAGLYTAPASLPSNTTVTITAVYTQEINEIGTAKIALVAAQPVSVSPAALAVPAGMTQTFTAIAGTPPAPVTATWEVNGTAGGTAATGTITSAGVYTAPLTPPPGGMVTISAVNGAGTGMAQVTVVYSDNSMSGPFAFSYSGSDTSQNGSGTGGLLFVAGSFTASPATGGISGVEDYNSLTLVAPAQDIAVTGSYQVNPDGTGFATLTNGAVGSENWTFTLGPGSQGGPAQHAVLVRFDIFASGSGTMDQQKPADLNAAAFNGSYVFGLAGEDATFNGVSGNALQFAGEFVANAASGTIPLNSAVEDASDNGANTLSAPDTSLHGLIFSVDNSSGRGTLQITNTGTVYPGTFSFAFYIVDHTHLKVVETDNQSIAQLAGDIYSAPSAPYSPATLSGHFAYTLGGASGLSPYAAGGVFVSNGSGSITGGVFDSNSGGSTTLDRALTNSTYAVDPNLGRVALTMATGGFTMNFGAYVSSNGYVEMILLSPNVVASGLGFTQTSMSPPRGSLALNFTGVNNSGGFEEDVAGQITIPGSTAPYGNLMINSGGTVLPGVPILSNSVVANPDSNGRGTMTVSSHADTFPLAYYTVDGTTFLVLEGDSSHTLSGVLVNQF